MVKVCRTCSVEQPADSFPGRSLQCRDCLNVKARARREANPDKYREQEAESRSRHTEARKARLRAAYAANRAERRAKGKAHYEANKAQYAANRRAWAKANPEKVSEATRQYRQRNPQIRTVLNQNRRARLSGSTSGPVDLDALWTGKCALCGMEMDRATPYPNPMSKSIDHIVPLARGGAHAQGNLQWAHLICNARKGATAPIGSDAA